MLILSKKLSVRLPTKPAKYAASLDFLFKASIMIREICSASMSLPFCSLTLVRSTELYSAFWNVNLSSWQTLIFKIEVLYGARVCQCLIVMNSLKKKKSWLCVWFFESSKL